MGTSVGNCQDLRTCRVNDVKLEQDARDMRKSKSIEKQCTKGATAKLLLRIGDSITDQ